MTTSEQVKRSIPVFPPSVVEAVAGILGDTNDGLTNSEIEKVLCAVKLPDLRKRAE